MALLTQQQSWRDRALTRSEGITDAWEVTKIYAGRLAEWVLFLCMILNIIEVLVSVPSWISGTILAVQAVTLDIGGFSLASMADAAADQGNTREAGKARWTGYLLITVMMLTLLLVSVGLLWPAVKPSMDGAEKALILVRVLMTVLYGHVVHSLRRHVQAILTPQQVATLEQRLQQQIDSLSHLLLPPPPIQNTEEIRAMVQSQTHLILEEVGGQLKTFQEHIQGQLDTLKLETPGETEEEEEEDEMETPDSTEEEDTPPSDVEEEEAYPLPRPRITAKLTDETKPLKKRASSNGRKTAQERAQGIVRRSPKISAKQLAERAEITPQYAYRILNNLRASSKQKEVDPSH